METEYTYQILLLSEFLLAPVVFFSLLFKTAPYGRHARPGWGPVMNARFAWIAMELPAVLTMGVLFLYNIDSLHPVNTIFILLWEFHYLYRTFYFPMQMTKIRTDFPVVIVLMAVFFNVLNGYVNGSYLFDIRPAEDFSFAISSSFVGGMLVFITGFVIHYRSDRTILRLRTKSGGSRYSIPRGGLFRWVSSPNYLGEFIQWCGWAILTWSLGGLAFAIFTLANLLPRAISNHQWYKSQFPDYPAKRKIFFPGVY